MCVGTLWAVFDTHEESYEIGGRGAVTDLHLIERGDANHTQSSGSTFCIDFGPPELKSIKYSIDFGSPEL